MQTAMKEIILSWLFFSWQKKNGTGNQHLYRHMFLQQFPL